MLGTTRYIFIIFTVLALLSVPAKAEECAVSDRPCVLGALEAQAGKIDNPAWRDQTYRELAKTYAFEGQAGKAISLVDKIENPDTKALTIRGIGMASADLKLTEAQRNDVFKALREKAGTITHPPSYAIALTYIAMAQAFAGDNEGAWKTASEMENDALRHKAYGETAEIQAERDDFESAMKSIEYIESEAYRNKSYETVAKILADRTKLDHAYHCAIKITNPYKQAEALQYILDKQKPREIPHQ